MRPLRPNILVSGFVLKCAEPLTGSKLKTSKPLRVAYASASATDRKSFKETSVSVPGIVNCSNSAQPVSALFAKADGGRLHLARLPPDELLNNAATTMTRPAARTRLAPPHCALCRNAFRLRSGNGMKPSSEIKPTSLLRRARDLRTSEARSLLRPTGSAASNSSGSAPWCENSAAASACSERPTAGARPLNAA